MAINNAILMIAIFALVWNVHATVFEAERSEDVDLFLDENQVETVGLLFYDSQAENTDTEGWFASLTSKILGVFMSQDQYGRSTEDWVEMFDDKLHLMRIDARNPNLMRSREEFNVQEDLPFIIIQDQQRTVLRERVNEDTYDHVRDLLDRRPNILHKTGGAALKSFSLEPDAENTDSAPRVIQYFDLEEGEPTNVEEPIQRQYVNWGATDVIGPDGRWMERGRNWVTSYEIPESGIRNQEKQERIAIRDRIKDDTRPLPAKPTQAPQGTASTQAKPTQPSQPAQGRPTQGAQPAGTSKPAQPTQPTSSAKPTQSGQPAPAAKPSQTGQPTSGARPTQGAPQPTSTRPAAGSQPTTGTRTAAGTQPSQPRPAQGSTVTQAKPTSASASTGSQPAAAPRVQASTSTRTTAQAAPTAGSQPAKASASSTTSASAQPIGDNGPERHRYHDRGYQGYGSSPYRGYY